MNEQRQGNFSDPKTIMAIILVGIVFFGWQNYLSKKYPDYQKPKTEQAAPVAPATGTDAEAPGSASAVDPAKPVETAKVTTPAATKAETTLHYENLILAFDVSSRGMGLKNIISKEFLDRHQQPVKFGADNVEPHFATRLLENNQVIDFEISKAGDNSFVGRAKFGEMEIKKTLLIDPSTGKIETEIMIEKPVAGFKGLATRFTEKKFIPTKGSGFLAFLMPSIEHQEFVIRKDGKTERVRADDPSVDHVQTFTNATMAAIGSQYFASAYVDHSDILPNVEVIAPKEVALKQGQTPEQRDAAYVTADIQYRPVSVGERLQLKSTTYVGGKSLSRLEASDKELLEVVNLGFFASIGKILLKILDWSHRLVGNWGWAIVILTLLVRLLVMPFNIASYKSMKKMQKIQPLLQSLRERYKDDPAAMNRESMMLMREHKVNPMGSCLPMLLQMPIFFALYQVLGQSIDLYQAPWIGWIHDLSLKDPYYILPVLMGIVMFLQQKLTPMGNMDPAQQKILTWMPVLFSVFMLGLPSGLTLYIFVSTLFSVIQQKIFMRDSTTKAPSILDVKAQRVH